MLTNISDVDGAMRLDPGDRQVKSAEDAESPRGLWGLIKTWDDRAYYRGQLARIANHTPELIEDIGLTRRQIEAEIAKPFWRR
jgi:uncharacterized protein YjiS (DUF1127 family)